MWSCDCPERSKTCSANGWKPLSPTGRTGAWPRSRRCAAARVATRPGGVVRGWGGGEGGGGGGRGGGPADTAADLRTYFVLSGLGGDQKAFAACRERHHLLQAGTLKIEHVDPTIGCRPAHGQCAVVAQEQNFLVPHIGDQPFALVVIERDALIVVIGQPRQNDQSMLA